MKSYTNIEQSRKLAEVLPIESADQTWGRTIIAGSNINVSEELQYKHFGDTPFILYSGAGVPCWSLAALLSLMPRIEYVKPFIDLSPNLDSEEVAIYYPEDSPYIVKDNLVDACVEMLIELHEQKIL